MLILLDIDGVMVPAKGWKSPRLLDDGFPAFSPKATTALQQLLGADTTVVLTTSHKSNYTIAGWKAIFKRRGIDVERLMSLTENVDNLSRKDEIVAWFRANRLQEDFIIIDDDKGLNDLPTVLKDRLVLTSPIVGLTEDLLITSRLFQTSRTNMS